MTKPKRYCYLAPDYPAKGWGITLFVERDGELFNHFTHYRFLTDFKDVTESAQEFVNSIAEDPRTQDVRVMDSALLLPLTLAKTIPLRREYWENPVVDFGEVARERAFEQALRYPLRYELLVVPAAYLRRHWYFQLAAPFMRGDTGSLEAFIRSSKLPVCEAANAAAMYDIGESSIIDWRTLETRQPNPVDWPDPTAPQ